MRFIRTITPALTRRFNIARVAVAHYTVNELVRHHGSWDTLDELVEDSLRTGYVPTMRAFPESYARDEMVRAAGTERVADAYDAAMVARGSNIRAYRGTELRVPYADPPSTGPTVWDRIASA